MIKTTIVFICILPLTACQVAYDSVKDTVQQEECHGLPSSAYDDCLRQRDKSYDDYETNRKEVLDKKD